MRKIYAIFLAVLLTASLFAQSPQKMSYQAVIRNSSDQLVTNHAIGMRVSILLGSETGTAIYKEIYNPNPQTNSNGLVTIEIGAGIPLTGTFAAIDWSAGTYFIKTETDPTGGTSYTITGTSQLLSVPYALHAKTVASYTETDPIWTTASLNYYTKTNMQTSGASQLHFNNLTNTPTTVAGYGITDGVNTTGNQTIAGNKTFTGTTTVPTPVNSTDAATKAYVDKLLSIIQTIQVGVNDLDGNRYKVIIIGNQVWMAENLKTTKCNDGTSIPLVTDQYAWLNLTTPGYCWPNGNAANKDTYGALYNWYTVNTGKLCPTGWHVPTDAEWTTMENYLIVNGFNYDGTTTGNKIAKALASTSGWTSSSNIGAVGNTDYPSKRNATGFTAVPGGYRTMGGLVDFDAFSQWGFWWSATEANTSSALNRWISCYESNISSSVLLNKKCGSSVRCLRD